MVALCSGYQENEHVLQSMIPVLDYVRIIKKQDLRRLYEIQTLARYDCAVLWVPGKAGFRSR
jgi:hypothetical protein